MDVVRETLPHFRENRSSLYINVSSGAGVVGLPMISYKTLQSLPWRDSQNRYFYELAALRIGVKIVEPGGVLVRPAQRQRVLFNAGAFARCGSVWPVEDRRFGELRRTLATRAIWVVPNTEPQCSYWLSGPNNSTHRLDIGRAPAGSGRV
jgi:hypothetical protein